MLIRNFRTCALNCNCAGATREVKTVKIRVKHEFYDKENDLKLRTVGEIMTVSKKRAEYLVYMKVAEVIDSKGGDPESPIEAQG